MRPTEKNHTQKWVRRQEVEVLPALSMEGTTVLSQVPLYTLPTNPELQDAEQLPNLDSRIRTPDPNRIPPVEVLAAMIDEIRTRTRTRTQIGGAACAR